MARCRKYQVEAQVYPHLIGVVLAAFRTRREAEEYRWQMLATMRARGQHVTHCWITSPGRCAGVWQQKAVPLALKEEEE